MSESRTKKASRNVIIGLVSRLIIMLLAFATKTVFLQLLGVHYNGVNGLFGNILAILALSELGVGNVLNYSLYRALKDNDQDKVKSLVVYFRKIYYYIAIAVAVLGLVFVPFLRFIVNSEIPMEELRVYYLFYLLNSVVSYFVVYKTTVITADQKNFINSMCEVVVTLLMYIAQIIYLLLYKNFLGYLVILVICTILKNAALSIITDIKYPYLRKLSKDVTPLADKDRESITNNIKSTFLYKISAVIITNTDNILISIIVGTVFVGFYSNYYMIITYLTNFTAILITGVTASLGNLNSEQNKDASYNMFMLMCMIFSFISTFTSTCFITCIQPFIAIWIGEENIMEMSWVIIIVINYYINTLMNPIWMFRETMGLFKQVRYIMLITAGLNLVLSVVLGIFFGVPGILAATFISRLLVQYWYEPKILFARFERDVKMFYLNQLKQGGLMLVATALSCFICHYIGTGILGIILRALISGSISLLILYFFNRKSEAMVMFLGRYLKPWLGRLKPAKRS